MTKAARINRAADFLDRRNREWRKRNGQAKVRSIEERKGRSCRWKKGSGRERKDRVVRELTTRSRTGKWRCPILPVSVPTSTFGVRKLNFCVRYGNRWNLSAIITTMVIYQTIFGQTYTNYVLKHNAPLLRGHYPLTPRLIFPASPPFKNFFLSISFPEDWQLHSKQFFVQTQNLLCFHLISS